MNRLLPIARISPLCARSASQLPTQPPPKAAVINQKPQYDELTHTGQAWDQADYRRQRFDTAPKQVNPNVAMNLVAQRPAQDCGHERVVDCDGGGGAMGHPRVFINLDKPGVHACGYCGNRFYNSHMTKGDDLLIEHLNC